MLLKTIALTVSALLVGTFGQDEHKVKTYVASSSKGTNVIALEQKGDEPSVVHINGKDYTLDMKDMKEGEEKVIVTDSGNLTLTKQADKYQIIDSKGTKMYIPALNNMFGDIAFTTTSDGGEDSEFAFAIDSAAKVGTDKDTVYIQGLDDLDAATKEKVRQALQDAGVEKDVQFGSTVTWVGKDGSIMTPDGHGFMFIKKDGDDKDRHFVIKKVDGSGDDDEDEDEDDDN